MLKAVFGPTSGKTLKARSVILPTLLPGKSSCWGAPRDRDRGRSRDRGRGRDKDRAAGGQNQMRNAGPAGRSAVEELPPAAGGPDDDIPF